MGEIIRMNDPRVARIIATAQEKRHGGRTYRTAAAKVSTLVERFPDGAWTGKRCFIVGGGPSLKGFEFNRLRGEHVIAINKAFYDVPFADIMFAMDRPLLDDLMSGKIDADYRTKCPNGPERDYRKALADFAGVKIWLDLSKYSYPPGVYAIPAAGEIGWTKSLKDGLYHGQSSGYGALNLAMVLGADPIYLLGYDCAQGPDGEKNYHEGYPGGGGNPDAFNTFKEAFKAGAKMLLPGRHHIVNLNPDSALRCFPFMDISAIHRLGKKQPPASGFVVISYYTKGTGYEQEIQNLEVSLKIHQLPYKIFEYAPVGTWRANLNFKSECILRALDLFPWKDIVFIDSDAVVRKYPVLFDELSQNHQHDISACFFKYDPRSGDADELLSGTLWIQNGDMGRKIVRKWHEIGIEQPKTRHQMCLKLAIAELERTGEKVRVYRHPFAYTCIYDYQTAYSIEPVIEHFQASRKLRKEVGYGVPLINRGGSKP